MNQDRDAKDVPLDDLVALVEKAARTIEHLQAEIRARDARITELEKSRAAIEKDAHWHRWFRAQYGNSPFFAAIEKAFQDTHVDFASSIGAKKTVVTSPSPLPDTKLSG